MPIVTLLSPFIVHMLASYITMSFGVTSGVRTAFPLYSYLGLVRSYYYFITYVISVVERYVIRMLFLLLFIKETGFSNIRTSCPYHPFIYYPLLDLLEVTKVPF